ncbi:YfgM family protein [Chitinimonas lacunae]|uniref:Ancillary SecYEG translocon subunit n=1 Tax=Chitinimonas lacunae TaxID=1963018 RepID=A0ABV8MM30_9NEIS
MAAFDLQEQEQIDELKAWWSKWGRLVSGCLIAVVVGYLGRHAWQAYQNNQGNSAAEAYAAVEAGVEAKDPAKVRAAAEKMRTDNANAALTPRAMLVAAKTAFEAGDLDNARKSLEWVVANAKEDALIDTANLRLAAVLLDQKQFDAALKAVQGAKVASFAALFADMRGDVLSIKGDIAGAKAAYQEALVKLDAKAPVRKLVETKLNALGA